MSKDDPDFAIRGTHQFHKFLFVIFFREINFMNFIWYFQNSDLYNAIAEGNYPSYTMYIQVMTFEEAENWKFNPFDLTKVWSHAEFPLIPVGKLVFNRNPRNYFAEVEQLAFSPAHLVPGIEPSPDKMLQVIHVEISVGST